MFNWKLVIVQSLVTELIFIGEALVASSTLSPGVKSALETLIADGQSLVLAIQSGK